MHRSLPLLFLALFISSSTINLAIASTQRTPSSEGETQKKKGFFSKKKAEFKEWRQGNHEENKQNVSSSPNPSVYQKALNTRDPYYICFDATTACQMSAAEYEFCQQSSDPRVQDEIYPLNICASATVQEVARSLGKNGLELNSSKNGPPPPTDDPRTFPSYPSNLQKQNSQKYQPRQSPSFSRSPLPPTDVTLSKEEIETYQSMPPEDQPVVPLENTFAFRGQRSTSYTLRMIEALDRGFFEQTGGLGVNRNIGTAKMLAIINKTVETGKHHLTDEEMDTYATSQILVYLHEIKSPGADNFVSSLKVCETQKTSCETSITFNELYGFIEKQKALILSKIKKSSPPRSQWIRAKSLK